MTQPTRQTPAGRAHLDLQNRARRESRITQELLTLYVVERWLAWLSASPYAEQFILKGGVLLAAYDARRPTPTLTRRPPDRERPGRRRGTKPRSLASLSTMVSSS